ncbi:cupin domain-containing protein [Psychrobacter aquimaris]|jgi:HTH-type transcriptional repressor of puuD|uniref:XRE family transcriptional regulator n=1 Tax=Psychrobacter immobilis TaxID=498 RepID=A0A2V1ZVB9_PSYIM|nr:MULTISPECIES: cupin domain-containing protein [Psychrobacter]PWK13283.1 XRE family transcriptional regulator [Psychrobacter immobilis]WLG12714.1 cupin domain-containing protein [Psychrobacter cibarius]
MPANPKLNSTTEGNVDNASTDIDINNSIDADVASDKAADIDTDDDISGDDEDELTDSETAMSAENDESPEEDIGKKINQLRLAKGYSQRKLAKLSGLTNTSISSIERNKVSPAVNTLKAILAVLGSDLTTFFSDEWKEPKARVVVTPKDLLELSEPSSRVSLRQVYNCSTTKNLGFLIEVYQPNSSTEEKIAHEGEEIGTVIEGKILIRIDETTYLLNQGDSYVIDTIRPHTFINPTDGVTRIVSAHTPTTY